MVSLDQLRILRKDLAKLDRSHILMPLTAHIQRMIIFLDRFIDRVQTVSVRLKLIDVFCCKVSRRLQVLADHPFTEC